MHMREKSQDKTQAAGATTMVAPARSLLPPQASALVRSAAAAAAARTAHLRARTRATARPINVKPGGVKSGAGGGGSALAGILVALAVVAVLGYYGRLCWAYYYRVVPYSAVAVAQCDASAFEPAMVDRRHPLICRGVSLDQVGSERAEETYGALSVRPLFSAWEPVVAVSAGALSENDRRAERGDKAERAHAVAALADVTLLVAMSERSVRVRLWHPDAVTDAVPDAAVPDSADSPDSGAAVPIDILLHEADGLFVPMLWRYAVYSVEAEAKETTDGDAERVRVLRWSNRLMRRLDARRGWV
jgi:hypothetical protein